MFNTKAYAIETSTLRNFTGRMKTCVVNRSNNTNVQRFYETKAAARFIFSFLSQYHKFTFYLR